MKAIIITSFGGPDVLKVAEVAKPRIGKNDVLIRVRAAGVNRPDLFQRKGNYAALPGVPADIPGLEVAGIVVAIGAETNVCKIGDRVCALVAGGGYAEYVAVFEGQCLPIPQGVSFEEAASLPETVFTVWDNVFRRGRLKAGECFLVHGGAGGIGYTAIQLAKAIGARVITTVSSEEKERFCLGIGADRVVNYKTCDFEEVLSGEGIDVILDCIGGGYFRKNMNLLRPDGRLVYINAMEGGKVELNILQLMQKRIEVTGSTLRSRDESFKKELRDAVYRYVWPLLTTGKFRAVVSRTFPFSEAASAHRLMEAGDVFGKIVLVF